MTTSKLASLAGAFLILGGCSTPEAEAPARDARRVQVGGRITLLGYGAPARLTPFELLERVGRDVVSGRDDEARARALRFGDVAELALYAALLGPAGDTPTPGLVALAQARASQGGGDWPRLLAERQRSPERFQEFATARGAALNGEDELDEGAGKGTPLLELEALRVRAELARRSGDEALADQLLSTGLELASRHAPAQALEFALASSGTLEPEGDWLTAVAAALRPLSSPAPWGDPAAWDQLLELEPVGAPWPDTARPLLLTAAWPTAPAEQGAELAHEPPSALGWTAVGRWRLERGEHQQALLALRRAQASSRAAWAGAHLKLLQARALLALDQPAPASALLIGLADRREPDVAQAATALLGVLRLRNGQLRRGHGLLRQAVEEGSAADWPGLAEAEADLGLTYLALGDPERGLNLLHRAQRRFQKQGALPQLRRSLKNEYRYLDNAGDDRAVEVRERCLRLGVDL